MQQAPANGPAPNLHAASHLVLLAMASDAHALHHWNQQEWGQTHTRKTTAASLTSELCSPALWQVGTKEKKRKEKEKEKEKRKNYAFRRQFNEKPSMIPGCPAAQNIWWLYTAHLAIPSAVCDTANQNQPSNFS